MTDTKAVSPFDLAFAKVQELAATFKVGEGRYLSPDYQEADNTKGGQDQMLGAGTDGPLEEEVIPLKRVIIGVI